MIALKIRSRVIQSLADEGQSSHGKASTMSVDGRNVLISFSDQVSKKIHQKNPERSAKTVCRKAQTINFISCLDFGLLFRVH